ncbi:hypothetical protein DMENIID0001_070880 [Sergentomyia squamirostris]
MKWISVGVLLISFAAAAIVAEEYMDMCPCLPVNMCRGVFRATAEDEMYFSRVLQCEDETFMRCCSFSVTVTGATEKTKTVHGPEVTTEGHFDETTVDSATESTTLQNDELDTEDARFDRDDITSEIPTSTIESRENPDGILVVYPTPMTNLSSGDRLQRAFEGSHPEDQLVLVFPQESPRETRATTSDDDETTPELPKPTKKFKYSSANRKRFMPILKINETDTTHTYVEGKPMFKVTNSDNRRFLEELYRNRTRFGTPASQITTSPTTFKDFQDVQKNEVIFQDVDQMPMRKTTTPKPSTSTRRTLYYDPTKRKTFLRKSVKDNEIHTESLSESFSTKQAVESNHREMIEEVLSELKKESNTLVLPKEVATNPSMAAKINNMQKRFIEKLVDKISTKMDRRVESEGRETATTKREQNKPFRGSVRYEDTVKRQSSSTEPKAPKERSKKKTMIPVPEEPQKRSRKPYRGGKVTPDHMTKEFSGEVTSAGDFRPSPLWTLQHGDDPFPVPQVQVPVVARESRDIVEERNKWQTRGFVPIPRISRTAPVDIVGPIPKRFTFTTQSPVTHPTTPHYRLFTSKIFSR